jgi:hypothetical protein
MQFNSHQNAVLYLKYRSITFQRALVLRYLRNRFHSYLYIGCCMRSKLFSSIHCFFWKKTKWYVIKDQLIAYVSAVIAQWINSFHVQLKPVFGVQEYFIWNQCASRVGGQSQRALLTGPWCRILRRILGPKTDVTGEWMKFHNEELQNLYCSPNIIRQIKWRRMRWAGHVARMGDERKVYRDLMGKPEGNRPLGRPRRRWEDGIRMDIRDIGCGTGLNTTGSGYGPGARCCEWGDGPSGSCATKLFS